MASRKSKVAIGDRVAYSRHFLRSIGAFTGDLAHGRGIVTGLRPLSTSTVLADIDWNIPDLPGRVNVANLSRVARGGPVIETQ